MKSETFFLRGSLLFHLQEYLIIDSCLISKTVEGIWVISWAYDNSESIEVVDSSLGNTEFEFYPPHILKKNDERILAYISF